MVRIMTASLHHLAPNPPLQEGFPGWAFPSVIHMCPQINAGYVENVGVVAFQAISQGPVKHDGQPPQAIIIMSTM